MRLLPLALAATAAAALAGCGPASSSSSTAAPSSAAAPSAPAAAPGTVSEKAACLALATWEANGTGTIARDPELQATFRDTGQPLSREFASWVADAEAGSDLVATDSALVSLECTIQGVTVFPSDSASAAPPASAAAPAPQTVTFEVTGSDAQVTYGPAGSDASGTVPMKVTQPFSDPVYYSLTAQLQGSGSVSCDIAVNGQVISKATASGGFNIASCEISKDPLSGDWEDTNAG